jgi:hypothetical protein
MKRNFIDFPPWRKKSCGSFEDFTFLAKDLVLAPEPLQLGRHMLADGRANRRGQRIVTAATDPAHQRR